jgi:hypothetical protein
MWRSRSRSSRDLGPMVDDWTTGGGFDSAAAPLRAGLWSCLVSSGSGGESERKRGFSLSAVVGPAPLPGVLHEPQGGGLRAAARAMGACRGDGARGGVFRHDGRAGINAADGEGGRQ